MERDTFRSEHIRQALSMVNLTAKRVLLLDCYEEYELKALISSLQLLLKEAEGK